ncbi:MAG: protein translocase subunit SecD [Candidatus Eiseniibacteriota bacterium]
MKRWKLVVLVLVLAAAFYYLWPSYQYYFVHSVEERRTSARDAGTEIADLRSKILHLGLDLQGGMHVVLEADLAQAGDDSKDAIDRVVAILRNRVDQFGVSEPVIQKQGRDRIVVDLAGVQDPETVRQLIGSTARLEFRMAKSATEATQIVDRLDRYLASAAHDTSAAGADSSLASSKPLSSQFAVFYTPEYGVPTGAFVRSEARPEVDRLLATAGVDSVLGSDAELLWGHEVTTIANVQGRVLYFLDRSYQLTGDQVKTAERRFDLDYENPNAPGVRLVFTNRGATRFAEVTKANVGNHMAIVLDDVVRSAPVIRDAIRGGVASITGSFTDEEAQVLATVLRAGALPVDVKIIEERTVGPSLGHDSIETGIQAGLYGAIAVVVFIVIWYQASGLVAVLALLLNIFLIFSGLAMLRGTLTLPGIAGIVLTIGIAVDANVLIFERIREELRNGKTVRAAIDSGYGRAFTTIIDSNLTTLIAAIVLFQYGTGPIRGFAVTLSIGIIANLFTAVMVTRMIFDLVYSRQSAQKLSI